MVLAGVVEGKSIFRLKGCVVSLRSHHLEPMANTQSGAAAELIEGRAIAQSHEAQHAARRRLSIILLGGGRQQGIRDV